MRKQKNNVSMKKLSNEHGPENYDFNANRGNKVKFTLKDNTVKKGVLLGLMPDNMIVVEFENGSNIIGLCEVDYSFIQNIETLICYGNRSVYCIK